MRVAGLDGIRFIAACWVVLSHFGGPPIFAALDRSSPAGYFAHGLMGVMFSGPAAVMVFFVVSGFCIHYPYAMGAPFRAAPYITRRYVRIGIPMLAALLLAAVAGMDTMLYFEAVLWSLVAEIIYYTLYPLVRRGLARFGIDALVIAAYIASLAVIVLHPHVRNFGLFGWHLTWVVGLPVWLLGVKAAEKWTSGKQPPADPWRGRWVRRLGIWAISSTLVALNFHSPIPHPWTLGLFSLLLLEWLLTEMRIAATGRGFPMFLERAGRWSYSLYLCHMIVSAIVTAWPQAFATVAPVVGWSGRIALTLVASYVFYLLVEFPSHRLARYLAKSTFISRRVSPPDAAILPREPS